MNIVFLASGENHNKTYPLCLQEYKGKTLLQYVVDQSLSKLDADYTFVFQKKDIKKYHLDNIAKVLIPESRIISLKGGTKGSACSALFAACDLDQEVPLLIVSVNEIVDIDYSSVFNFFNESNADGGVMTFHSVHPRYSYVKYSNSKIIEFCQQNPVSNLATTGSFWFRKTKDFVQAAKKSIFNNCVTSNQFYIAPVYNQMILSGQQIVAYDVRDHYIPFKADLALDKNFA